MEFVEVDVEGFIEGLFIVDGVLFEDLMVWVLYWFGYEVVWIDWKRIWDLIYFCCIVVVLGDYLVLFGREGDIF